MRSSSGAVHNFPESITSSSSHQRLADCHIHMNVTGSVRNKLSKAKNKIVTHLQN